MTALLRENERAFIRVVRVVFVVRDRRVETVRRTSVFGIVRFFFCASGMGWRR